MDRYHHIYFLHKNQSENLDLKIMYAMFPKSTLSVCVKIKNKAALPKIIIWQFLNFLVYQNGK